MPDMEKYRKIYEEIERLTPEDTLRLVLESPTEEQKRFFETVGNFLLQKEQRRVIEGNLF